ncbi:MAG: hypothetical protein KDL87_19325, partial [Verrucomicrobiae bacterium]|nr:hypothetical protein [Verrucomicrobiae bacterium]
SLALLTRGGSDLGGGVMQNATGRPIFNRPDDLVFPGTRKGTGVTGANDAALFHSNGGGLPNVVLAEGDSPTQTDGAAFSRFLEIAQRHTGANGDLAVAFQYKNGPGGVNRSSDSGVLALDHNGDLIGTVFDENHNDLASMPGVFWGQFAPRVSKTGSKMAWTAFLLDGGVTAANNQGLFSYRPGVGDEELLARKGNALPGGTISTIVAEAINGDNETAFRAALTNAPKSENEALVFDGATVWNKGDLVSNFDNAVPVGVRIVRLLKFWPIAGN